MDFLKSWNMAGRPEKPEKIFDELTEDFKKIYGKDLISIILYGSGARTDYRPGRSDLNFLIVLSEEAIDELGRAMDILPKWKKKRVATPLFMTPSFILSSLDAYPIEFLGIKRHYVLVHGEDVLKEINFDPRSLRLQCERELKGKLVLLRTHFLETGGREDKIRELIRNSMMAFISIFYALLYLRGLEIPGDRRFVIAAVAKEFGLDAGIFLKGMDIREDIKSVPSQEVKDLFRGYLKEVEKLMNAVDRYEI
jgi:predicted nucleotidyltransferase